MRPSASVAPSRSGAAGGASAAANSASRDLACSSSLRRPSRSAAARSARSVRSRRSFISVTESARARSAARTI
ncbi:MAG: hypothetical protein EBS20_00600 [Actinobacteria bacterium]|nr:hypothetical protein [Actinomycetota bacterium]